MNIRGCRGCSGKVRNAETAEVFGVGVAKKKKKKERERGEGVSIIRGFRLFAGGGGHGT